ncbi:MAG: GDP-mannose 4,6-dehydratase [Chloroflexota bacterium]
MQKKYLVTGGAGFIGSNYVYRLLSRGERATVLDDLSRPGANRNVEWLMGTFGQQSFEMVVGDIRDEDLVSRVVKDADVILHLAGQVAVTTSIARPREDFEVNALGTLNVLEAARISDRDPIVLYASTNKVYGALEAVGVIEQPTRYSFAKLPYGVSETHPLDFHSPYGCSKGAGDQYTMDFHRIYGLRTVVFRQSCIYGPRQFGIEDQGWLAWFTIAVVTGRPISIYGSGKQVRDVLHIDDLLDLYDIAVQKIGVASGKAYNVGGGVDNTLSIWIEFSPLLEKCLGRRIEVEWGPSRPGDQRVYISDIRKVSSELGWRPRISVGQGVESLYNWVVENRNLFT